MPEDARRGTRFQDLVGELQRAAPNVARLKALQGEGIRLYQRQPHRSALFTRRGKTLGPVLKALHGCDAAQRNRRQPARGEGQ
jgi:hypothetical protein